LTTKWSPYHNVTLFSLGDIFNWPQLKGQFQLKLLQSLCLKFIERKNNYLWQNVAFICVHLALYQNRDLAQRYNLYRNLDSFGLHGCQVLGHVRWPPKLVHINPETSVTHKNKKNSDTNGEIPETKRDSNNNKTCQLNKTAGKSIKMSQGLNWFRGWENVKFLWGNLEGYVFGIECYGIAMLQLIFHEWIQRWRHSILNTVAIQLNNC